MSDPENPKRYKHDPIRLLRPTMMSGLCSMVPVPFLDDILIRRVRKGMVHRILREHGATLEPESIRSVYEGTPKGCLATAVALFFKGITKILRKLLRTVFFVLAVRASALEMVETFLVGRTVERCLDRDLLQSEKVSEDEALRVRAAFDEALSGSDRRILAQAMKAGWKRAGGVRHLARTMVGRFAKGSENEEIEPEDLDDEGRSTVEKGGEDIGKEVETREVKEFLAAFDTRFDSAFSRQGSEVT